MNGLRAVHIQWEYFNGIVCYIIMEVREKLKNHTANAVSAINRKKILYLILIKKEEWLGSAITKQLKTEIQTNEPTSSVQIQNVQGG